MLDVCLLYLHVHVYLFMLTHILLFSHIIVFSFHDSYNLANYELIQNHTAFLATNKTIML